MSVTLAWFGIWSTALLAIGMLHKKIVRHRVAKVLLFPGMLMDAVLRSLGCLLSATPIHRVSPLSTERAPVECGKSLLGPLGACIDVLVRCSLLLVATYVLLRQFPAFLESGFALPLIDEETVESGVLAWDSFPAFWEQLLAVPPQLSAGTLTGWMLLYTLAATLIFAGIQHREFAWVGAAWLGALFLGVAGSWLGIKFGFFSNGWFIQILYVPQMWSAFSLVVVLTFAVAALLATLHGITFLLKPIVMTSNTRK